MAINLSDITFTDEGDIVPSIDGEPTYAPEPVFLFGATVNTLAGDDILNGSNSNHLTYNYGFSNYLGTLNTNSGNDNITGIYENPYNTYPSGSGIVNRGNFDPIEAGVATINTGDGDDWIVGISAHGSGIKNVIGIIDTGDDNDLISGSGYSYGIITEVTTIDTGNGNDTITGSSGGTGIDSRANTTINTGDGNDIITGYSGSDGRGIFLLSSVIDTGQGNDIIEGTSQGGSGLLFGTADFSVEGRVDTGEGDDVITGTGSDYGIYNLTKINTGNGADSIISQGTLFNSGEVFLGDGNDSITANTVNSDDIITSAGIIDNQGVINTGNGADSIIVDGGFNGTGSVFLGEGEDYIKGFGSGDFYGGNGNDTLELTPGSYTVGIGDTSTTFTKGNQLLITSEFEQLIAGSTIYDFTSLTAGQIIVVA
jgi:hypothetical protein